MVPVEDTALAVADTGGPGVPVVYLNGQFASRGRWRRVVAELGPGFRHITYDERGRGRRSGRSSDCSFEAAVLDVDAVLDARGVRRPLLVGWAYGASVAAHWAGRNPAQALGAVMVDGAHPRDWLAADAEARLRRRLGRLRPFMPLLRPAGLVPRMSAAQMARGGAEVGRVALGLGPVLDGIAVPARYVVASGARSDEEAVRGGLRRAVERNPNLAVSAEVAASGGAVLRRGAPAVADAVREVAALAARRRGGLG